jgi:hypothetical protein
MSWMPDQDSVVSSRKERIQEAKAQARAWHEVENRAGAPDDRGHPFPRAERVQLWVECPSWELRDDVATVKAYQSVDKVRGGLGEREAEGH